jgi:hypothetical protein
LAKESRERGHKPHYWDAAERKVVDKHLKSTYGLNGNKGDNTGGWPCYNDIKAVIFPGYFHGCTQKSPRCKNRHALTATEAGAPYMDGSESQKDAVRALTPSWVAAIADGTLQKSKVPKKAPGT